MNATMKSLSALAIVTAALAATAMPSSALPNGPAGSYLGGGHGPVQPPKQTSPIIGRLEGLNGHIPCFVCIARLPPHLPPHLPPGGRDGDHGGHGWNQWYRWNHGYGWRNRPEIIVEGQPQAVGVSAPVQSAPVYAPAAAPQAAAEPCNCLTKQSLPDGSVLFQDICTKESAIASPTTVGAR
jgi:hypothetical protein